MTSLNPLKNLSGEIVLPYAKITIVWVPIEMTGFCTQKFAKQMVNVTTPVEGSINVAAYTKRKMTPKKS